MEIRLKLSLNFVSSEPVLEEITYTLTTNKERSREMLIKAIADENSKAKIIVPDLLPKFITVQKVKMFLNIKDYEGVHMNINFNLRYMYKTIINLLFCR